MDIPLSVLSSAVEPDPSGSAFQRGCLARSARPEQRDCRIQSGQAETLLREEQSEIHQFVFWNWRV